MGSSLFPSGLTLKSGDIKKAAKFWPALLYGLVAILGLTPFGAFLALRLPLSPPEFGTGLAVFCCMPTTLSSGVSLSQAAGGNVALALSLTVLSNLIGITTMPFFLSLLVSEGRGVSLPVYPLISTLLRTLLLPLLLGVSFRNLIPGLANRVDKNRKLLSLLSSFLLSLVPWMLVSSSVSSFSKISFWQLSVPALAGTILHILFLVLNRFAIKTILMTSSEDSSKKEVERSVILVASQKTLPVAIVVMEGLGGVVGETALMILPCIATHLTQIIVDSFLVNYWLKNDKKDTNLIK